METIEKLDYAILNDLKARAFLNSGECLSSEYINCKTPMLWRCDKGHSWEATSTSIKQGSWCPMCNKRKRKGTIEEIQKIAEERGGKCLSKEYFNDLTKIELQCKEGHTWKTRRSVIKNGGWCKVCLDNSRKNTIEEMHQIATERGGQCLSKEYINRATKLKWKCKNGHTWNAAPFHVKLGSWCIVCAINTGKDTIGNMQLMAKNRGGKCLSNEYVNSKTHLLWRCEKGHEWNAQPSNVTQGKWCPVCGRKKRRRKLPVENMQLIAKTHNEKCVTNEYINSKTPLFRYVAKIDITGMRNLNV